jgi:hypothetical protein
MMTAKPTFCVLIGEDMLRAEVTSATPAYRAIRAGRRSIEAFQIRRCSSYAVSSGRIGDPPNDIASSPNARLSSSTALAIALTRTP